MDTIKELGKYSKLYIKITQEEQEKEKTNKLLNLIKDYEGEIPVYVYFEHKDELKMLPRQKWVKVTDKLLEILSNEFGSVNVKLV